LRLVRFESDGVVRWGVLEGQSVRPVRQFRYDAPVEPDDTALPVGSVRLLPPADPPRNVFCMGLNYLAHVEESPARQVPKEPVWFTKATTSMVGPEEDVVVGPRPHVPAGLGGGAGRGPPAGREEDPGQPGPGPRAGVHGAQRPLREGRAVRPGGQWLYGKSLDGLSPAGPVLVTSEEIPDPQDLELWLRVNG
jgi:2,4-diketo-3-deoxy-L-fuconate hydrolase